MNGLADSTSPYLRQHADNPVEWYPWGEEAFAEARRLDRPIFVSIGYSACHWCHVMAHESFEDPETAKQLNAHFISIKVDREERPDVDALYMEAVQALNGQGGWPLSVFITPQGAPFFGGTYFPKRSLGQVPSFTLLLERVHEAWTDHRQELITQGDRLREVIATRLSPPPFEAAPPTGRQMLAEAVERFRAIYDEQHGGVGGAPKFPQTTMFELMLRAAAKDNDRQLLAMLQKTLAEMASGGIYDHLGGGFCRYSTDAGWQIPHFEKMLYDQSSLARLYLHAFEVTGDERWRQVVEETVGYVLRDLGDGAGGIFSSEDADSEGEEGKFYVFSADEFARIVGPELLDAAADWYGVTEGGNFEHGTNVLHRFAAGDLLRPPEIETVRRRLFEARRRRVHPGTDDKILTEWNAMFGVTLCEAADALDNDAYRLRAEAIAHFLLEHLRRPDGRWLRSYRQGTSAHLAVATDYAWLIEFFSRLHATSGQQRWIDEAKRVASALDELFAASDGGLYTTGVDGESLVVRPRDSYDGVTPSASSVAANALVRLAALTGDGEYARRAGELVHAGGEALARSPLALSGLVAAALSVDDPPLEIVVVGERSDLVTALKHRYLPDGVLTWGERGEGSLWEGRTDGFAYVCRQSACLEPTDDLSTLISLLSTSA